MREDGPPGPHGRDERTERTVVPFGPAIPDWATESALDHHVLREFEALGDRRSSEVARRLVAAYVAADEGDFDTALGHVGVVRVVGARLAAAREAAGIIAYRCGEYELAAKDLRAARRISGRFDTLPVLADCERGLGRPEKALELAASPEAGRLDLESRIEMLLVAAGARQDLGQADAAVLTLQVPELKATHKQEWHYRLVAGYAEALAAAGRETDAANWRATAAVHPAAPAEVADTGPSTAHGRDEDLSGTEDEEEFDFVDVWSDEDNIVEPDAPSPSSDNAPEGDPEDSGQADAEDSEKGSDAGSSTGYDQDGHDDQAGSDDRPDAQPADSGDERAEASEGDSTESPDQHDADRSTGG